MTAHSTDSTPAIAEILRPGDHVRFDDGVTTPRLYRVVQTPENVAFHTGEPHFLFRDLDTYSETLVAVAHLARPGRWTVVEAAR